MTSASKTTQRADNWGMNILQNCCLLEEMRYASEQLRQAMSRLPANTSLEGLTSGLTVGRAVGAASSLPVRYGVDV